MLAASSSFHARPWDVWFSIKKDAMALLRGSDVVPPMMNLEGNMESSANWAHKYMEGYL